MDKLKVSTSGHYLENATTGEPFMWMGIVPWKLPEKFSRADVDYFITEIKKSEHPYNVIMAVAIMSRQSEPLNPANYYGHQAFNGGDTPDFTNPKIVGGGGPDSPNDFWDHMDYIVRECDENDIYLCLVPQWSNMYVNDAWGRGLTKMTDTVARGYGEFLGDRYSSYNNIIWMMGGDGGNAETQGTKGIYRAQAEGILKGYTGCESCPAYNSEHALWAQVMMSYHGNLASNIGTRVSQIWGVEDVWIDIDGTYNATARRGDYYDVITDGYDLVSPKPMIEVEGQGFWDEYNENWPADFGGTLAFPYMHYFLGGAGPSNLDQHWDCSPGWEDNLNLSVRNWVGHMIEYMKDAWYNLIPDNSIIMSSPGTLWGEIVAAKSVHNDLIMVSFSTEGSGTAQLDLNKITSGDTVVGTWFNPEDGSSQAGSSYSVDDNPTVTIPVGWDSAVLKLQANTPYSGGRGIYRANRIYNNGGLRFQ